MTKGDLIYDWRKSESSFRDKIAAYLIVTFLFAVFLLSFQISYSTPRYERSGSATALRFRSDDLGLYWHERAVEDGPFPGRYGLEGYSDGLPLEESGNGEWNQYRSRLRTLGADEGYSRESLAPEGKRVYPTRIKLDRPPTTPTSKKRAIRQVPVLIPYDPGAMKWIPDSLPDFEMPEESVTAPADWRFTVNLAPDGNVLESISLAGGNDPGQAAMEKWLRKIRFEADGTERWLGLRVEFINRPDRGTYPE